MKILLNTLIGLLLAMSSFGQDPLQLDHNQLVTRFYDFKFINFERKSLLKSKDINDFGTQSVFFQFDRAFQNSTQLSYELGARLGYEKHYAWKKSISYHFGSDFEIGTNVERISSAEDRDISVFAGMGFEGGLHWSLGKSISLGVESVFRGRMHLPLFQFDQIEDLGLQFRIKPEFLVFCIEYKFPESKMRR